MIMSDFSINIVPIIVLQEEIAFSFSKVEKGNFTRIYKDGFPKNIPSNFINPQTKYAWWSKHLPQNSDQSIMVNLIENKRFAKKYFNKILYDYFNQKGFVININFINDTEVYIEDVSIINNEYRRFHRFSLHIDLNYLINGFSLRISYDGVSKILKRNIKQLGIEMDHIGRIFYNNKITKYSSLSESEKADSENIYPILNFHLISALNINTESSVAKNKYRTHFDQITSFYEKFLKGISIDDSIKILESGLYKPSKEKINHTTDDSNRLLFGKNQYHNIPFYGLQQYGPLDANIGKPVKLIFIFHEDDKEYANRMASYLKKGFKSFPGLQSFIKIDYELDVNKSIQFKAEDPIDEIRNKINQLQSNSDSAFNPNVAYAAIYISRIEKDSGDEHLDEIYYRLKELLLHHKITSQVIYKNKIDNPSFFYFLPNISIALLAKLGGIPWRLYRPIKNDLVVGIGADRTWKMEKKYMGNAFCFRNDGRFVNFNVFTKDDTVALANSLIPILDQYINENQGVDRLVIHYYKTMSEEEERPIRNALLKMQLRLPYVILSINETESKEYILFDNGFDGKMPQSGTYIRIKRDEFLLCNNTRYSRETGTRIDGFPLPIKIKVKTPNYEEIKEGEVISDLIDQVYQFSRMYWKSVRQRNMPVTIEYSKIIAQMASHFENKNLEPFARNTLWFL